MPKTKSFLAKLWLYFILFAAIIFSLLWALQTVFLQQFYNGMLTRKTRASADELATASRQNDFAEIIDSLARRNSLLVYVTDMSGNILYSSDFYKSSFNPTPRFRNPKGSPQHKNAPMGWQIGSYRNLPDGFDTFLTRLKENEKGKMDYTTGSYYVCGSQIELRNGEKAALYVSAALRPVGAAASIIRTQLFWVTAASFLLAFIFAYFLARRFSVPIKRLSAQAKLLGTDSYANQPADGFCRELDDLNETLNQTAGALLKAQSYQKELLANVSHDLRTPLTMIKGYAEMLRDVSWSDEAQRIADADIIIREADRLSALVNEILEYSRLQDAAEIRFTVFDMSALAESIADRFAPLLLRNNITLKRDITKGLSVSGDPGLLERAVCNLLDNAARHSLPEGEITLSLSKMTGIRLEVSDRGNGIGEEELNHIWEKYYTSRQSGTGGGSGLGLAIVKMIAQIHGAEYGVFSKKGEGSAFWLELPSCEGIRHEK